ncbi:MAG: hypothetical protein ABJN51_17300, partial [Sneathiella sp.]
ITLIIVLLGGAFFVLDTFLGRVLSFSIAAPIRLYFMRDVFDDTYWLDPVWPVAGGTPARLTITVHRGDEVITSERIIRCYQEKSVLNTSSWVRQIGMMEIPFPDKGGVVLTGFPKICDESNGKIVEHQGDMKRFSYLLLDDLDRPGIIISVQTWSPQMALNDDAKSRILPRFSYEVREIRGIDNPEYSSNKETERYSWAIGRYTKSYVADRLYIKLAGLVYFPSQWEENAEASEIVASATSPTLIPSSLMSQLPYDLRDGDPAEYHVFLKRLKISPVNPYNPNSRNHIYFRLTDDHSWVPDFDSLGIRKSYFRGCRKNATNTCLGPQVARPEFIQDVVKIGGFELTPESRDGVYLPDKNIILVPGPLGPKFLPSK